jgi:hypothetical protein
MKKVSTLRAKQSKNFSRQKLTIGLDLGDRSSWYCVLNEAGEIVLEQRLGTTPKAMQEVLGRGRGRPLDSRRDGGATGFAAWIRPLRGGGSGRVSLGRWGLVPGLGGRSSRLRASGLDDGGDRRGRRGAGSSR